MGYGVYFFFASLMVMSAAFVFFLLPETKGLPLETMDRLFQVKPVWKAHPQIMEELRLQEEEFRNNAGDVDLEDEKADMNAAQQKEVV
jgi:hypothetical protein